MRLSCFTLASSCMLVNSAFLFIPRWIVFNYVAGINGAHDKPCLLSAAVCISLPWNFIRVVESMEEPLNHILFQVSLVKALCKLAKKNADILSPYFDVQSILKVYRICDIIYRSLWPFVFSLI